MVTLDFQPSTKSALKGTRAKSLFQLRLLTPPQQIGHLSTGRPRPDMLRQPPRRFWNAETIWYATNGDKGLFRHALTYLRCHSLTELPPSLTISRERQSTYLIDLSLPLEQIRRNLTEPVRYE